jgi:transcription initiation factor TFIID subunit 11
MGDKRVRDIATVITESDNNNDKRINDIDETEKIAKRTKFIKEKLDCMSEEQLTRFEFFFRSHFSRNTIKDLLISSVGKKWSINDEMAIVVSSLAKLFVGELVETAMIIQNRDSDQGIDSCLDVESIRYDIS